MMEEMDGTKSGGGGGAESVLWKGRSSQIVNFWTFVGAGAVVAAAVIGGLFFAPLFAVILLPLAWAGWRALVVRFRVYELTSQRLRLYTGVLNRRIDEIELYRVKDTIIEQPLWQRIFKLGTLVIETSDRSHPSVVVAAIPDAIELREQVRRHVERLRDQKRVREIDFEGSEGDGFEGDFDAS